MRMRMKQDTRTRIGNTPTCASCGEQHSTDADCAEVDKMASSTSTSTSTSAITIGTEYLDRNKRACTVVDIWKTFNNAGELVQTRYVCAHVFLGQTVTERDVLAITIQKGLKGD